MNIVQDAGVLVQDDSAAPVLRETPFVHAFSTGVMHEEKSEDAFSFGVLHEEQSKDASSVGKAHPPAILHTLSALVPKQGTFVRNPSSAVDNDDTVQPTAAAGRGELMARHPETCDACMLRSGRLAG